MASTDVEIRIRAVDQYSRTMREAGRAIKGLEQSGSRGTAAAIGRQNRIMAALSGPGRSGASGSAGGGIGMPFGLSPTMLGGLGAGYGAKEIISSAADFESALTEIRKKAGLSAEETAMVGEEIKALSVSGDVISSIDEIAKAYERGGAAGIPLNELREFAAVSAKAADAFGMSAEDASNAIAGWQKNLQMNNGEIREMLDLVNALADAGTADEADVLGFLGRSGSSLKNAGFDAKEVAALGTTMLNLGIDWETASRGINSTTTRLLSPASKKATVALRHLFGGTKGYEDFRERFSEDGMAGLLEFIDKVGELDQLEQVDVLSDVVGLEFGPIIQRLVAARTEIQRNLDLMNNRDSWFGGLDKSYDLKKTNFWSQWQLLKNEFGALTIDVGTAGMPVLKSGLEGIRELVREIEAGMARFEMTLDYTEINNAKAALGELGEAIKEFMGIKTDNSPISSLGEEAAREVNRLARVVNRVSETIDAYKRANDDDPSNDPPKGTNVVSGLIDAGRIALGRDEIAAYNAEKERSAAQSAARPGTSARIPPADASRFGAIPDAPPPPPVQAPDMTAYFAAMGQAEQARIPVEQPIVTSADLNTAAFMAGLGQMTVAARATRAEIQSILGGISAGGGVSGNNYDSHKRSQFAPVGPAR